MKAISSRAQVLILTDDSDASRAWSHVLSRYDIDVTVTDYSGLPKFVSEIGTFRELLVDHYQDAQSALEICQKLRTLTQHPILLFTYETDERYHIQAYRLGVEECVRKPIGIPLFVAKTRSWLRRVIQDESPHGRLSSSNLYLDPQTRILENEDGETVRLSNLECRLMTVFMTNPGQVLESNLLTDRVWSMYSDPDPQMLKNLVYRLRNKIQSVSVERQHIERVSGIGYVFQID